MPGRKQRMVETARRNRVEIVEAGLSRRDLAKLGLLTTAGFLVTKLGLSARAEAEGRLAPMSPATTPWVEELPRLEVAKPVDIAELVPAPQRVARGIAEEPARAPHQHWERFDRASADVHVLESRITGVRWHREFPPDPCWCWNGVGGPLLHAQRGRPTLVRFRNQLPTLDLHRGYGRPVLAPHAQGAELSSESDGDPFTGIMSGQWRDQLHLHGVPASEADMNAMPGANSIPFHDVLFGAGAQNTYRGLVALQLVFDRLDSGDEADPNPEAWRLPSGEHDIPLVLHDRAFDANGHGYYDLFDLDGLVGDKVTVNGRIQPFLRLARRKVRLRFFNVGPARTYRLHLSNDQEMVQVAEDGGMLVQPRRTRELKLGVGRSAEVVLDLAPHAPGTRIFLLDVHERLGGGRPTGRYLPLLEGARILRLDVDGRPGKPEDPSRIPGRFIEQPSIDMTTAATTRTFVLERAEGSWTVNGRPFDPEFMAATPKLGTAEAWTFVNRTGLALPGLELHLGLHDVIARGTGSAQVPVRTRGSVIDLASEESVTVWRRFDDFTGSYTTRSRYAGQADQGLLFRWRVEA